VKERVDSQRGQRASALGRTETFVTADPSMAMAIRGLGRDRVLQDFLRGRGK